MAEKVTFIFGGARSGKSSYAVKLAQHTGSHVLFIATARVLDKEMEHRVAMHKAARPAGWSTLEAPENISTALRGMSHNYSSILLDCVTLMLGETFSCIPIDSSEEAFTKAADDAMADLVAAIDNRPEPWFVVSNEVGMGIVPETRMGRIFRDAQGRANQRLAELANEVYLMAAGIPLKIK
jgi:adenosylcobinamide kinase / adenosylcobinamide-phosphate guanylyltransferase